MFNQVQPRPVQISFEKRSVQQSLFIKPLPFPLSSREVVTFLISRKRAPLGNGPLPSAALSLLSSRAKPRDLRCALRLAPPFKGVTESVPRPTALALGNSPLLSSTLSCCHPERSRGICSSTDLAWEHGIRYSNEIVISPAPACRGTGAYPDFLPRSVGHAHVCGFR